MKGPIALMTDFGLRDPFAGIMKGVILGVNPSARIVDVCHDIRQGDIKSAAFALFMAFAYFPAETMFVIVVDPGIGTERKAIAAEIEDKIVVCPDNGILSWVLHHHELRKAVELSNGRLFLPNVSGTFHGRDVFAPVAANLSLGVGLQELGKEIKELTTFPIPEVGEQGPGIQGEVVYMDRFGNLITNILSERLPDKARIHIGSVEVMGVGEAYGDVPQGHAVAVVGSMGCLEIAVNGGDASQMLGASIGTHISVYEE